MIIIKKSRGNDKERTRYVLFDRWDTITIEDVFDQDKETYINILVYEETYDKDSVL